VSHPSFTTYSQIILLFALSLFLTDELTRINYVYICSDPGPDSQCEDGVPTTCDARCAVTWDPYYAHCSHLIQALMSPSQLVAFQRLDVACNGLPTADLLTALGKCVLY
jgi:hypothetical protein